MATVGIRAVIAFGLLLAAASCALADAPPLKVPPRYAIEVEGFVLTDVPVRRLVITALDEQGELDPTVDRRIEVRGVRLSERRAAKSDERHVGVDSDVALPPFVDGVLALETDLAAGRKVYVTDPVIVVDGDGPQPHGLDVPRTLRWFSLVPPLLAIVLAIWLRNVLAALFAAIWSGAVILARGDFFTGFVTTVDEILVGEITDADHAKVILFTLFLGATVGLMTASGGTHALVSSLARFARKREHGQLMTWALGLVVFFDDYANTLLLGSTMRPVTDRLKISRAKLAFLVDSTAAPVAGLALISTWVGFEVGLIRDAYDDVFAGASWDAYSVFLATIPYRFYPVLLIVFVWLIAYTGHDYGPMRRAEVAALADRDPSRGPAVGLASESGGTLPEPHRPLLRNALVPLATLLVLLLAGLWWSGWVGLATSNAERAADGRPEVAVTLWSVVGQADSYRVLLLASFLASITAVVSAIASRALTLNQSLEAWTLGAKSMVGAIMILVLAWGVGTVCNAEHLNTAGVLIELSRGMLSPRWMPAIAFLLAAVISFATGSSFSTMGILMPLLIPLTYYLLLDANDAADPQHQLLLATIGAVLAGAIFGDHCSPISDTTVLSSAASECDHLEHVATQMPYALTVGAAALFLGYIPAGFGYSPILMSSLAMLLLYLIVQFIGRPADWKPPVDETAPPLSLADLADIDMDDGPGKD
ncbi:MAG: Na+/H+ antiporter NhaC family protein [Planctomycetaceae bacterium]